MKKLILLLLVTLSSGAYAQECPYKIMERSETVITFPVYKASAYYLFDDAKEKAMAQVDWKYDSERTSFCFRSLEKSNPGKEVKLALLRFPEFQASVLFGNESKEMVIYPQAGGQYHAGTTYVDVDYSKKKEIIRLINDKKDLIRIKGDFVFRFEGQVRQVVGNIECTNSEVYGLALIQKRLDEVVKEYNKITSTNMSRNAIMGKFLKTCVEVDDSEKTNLIEMSQKTKLIKGTIKVDGTVAQTMKETIPAYTDFEIQWLEY